VASSRESSHYGAVVNAVIWVLKAWCIGIGVAESSEAERSY
jgi:hypothetical protein